MEDSIKVEIRFTNVRTKKKVTTDSTFLLEKLINSPTTLAEIFNRIKHSVISN